MVSNTGGISLKEIKEVAEDVIIPDSFASDPAAMFVHKVSKLANLRKESGGENGVTVFVKSASLNSVDLDWEENLLLKNGVDPISGLVVLTNAAMGTAYIRSMSDDEQTHPNGLLVQEGLDRLPTIIIDWRGQEPVASLYREGLSNTEEVHDIYLFEDDITADMLKACLDKFYEQALRSPQLSAEGNKGRVWQDAPKGIPVEKTEAVIQGELLRYLQGKFGAKIGVHPEVKNEEGRADILLFHNQHNQVGTKIQLRLWQLELKALREKTAGGNTVTKTAIVNAIEEGMSQAIRFKESLHANNSALCCYDMQKLDQGDQNLFSSIYQAANDNEIDVWRWFLYRSSSDARKRAD